MQVVRKNGREADCTALEKRHTERYPGFESLFFRKIVRMVNVFFTILILIVKIFTMKGICKNCETEFDYHPSQSGGIYCSNKCQGEHTILKRFVKGTNFRNTMRKYLVENTKYECNSCGISDYKNKPITLQVDHIDGDRTNNEFDNLRFLCPNCHSQTDTWGISNMSEEGRKNLVQNGRQK